MGRVKASFKASLDWVLKFDVIQRILEGDFGVKKEALHASSSEKMNSASEEDYIQAQQESNEIKKLRMDLLNRVGEGAYRSWFKPVPIIKKDTGFSMMGQGTFWKNYVNTHYKNVLMALCVDV
jgi:hypothetical protein